jgi:hypothetical protein
MNTCDTDILKQFQTVLNRKHLNESVYEALLRRWGLDKVDLDEEVQKINLKKSSLSSSKRKAVFEFVKLRELLNEKKAEEQEKISMKNEDDTSLYQDTIVN